MPCFVSDLVISYLLGSTFNWRQFQIFIFFFWGGGGDLISNYTVHQQIIVFTSYLMKKIDLLFLGLNNTQRHSSGLKI